MITKGIVLHRITNTNKYLVRIPYFSQPGSFGEPIFEATLNYTPGIYEGFKENDIVFIGFEDHKLDKPVIIGKLYVDEDNNEGYANINSLTVSDNAILPENTSIGDINYFKLKELIRKVSNLEEIITNTKES